jgi:hypothetical protein
VALGLLGARSVRAQDSGTDRAAVVLALPASTPSLGVGGADVAAVRDEWSLFVSPAQLARVRGVSAGAATQGYLASTVLSAAALAVPVGRGVVGIGATLLDYGSIDEIATTVPGADGSATGQRYSAQENAVVVGYGLPIGAMRIGIVAEFAHTRVADLSASAVAGSAGVAWTNANGWDFSAVVQHVGGDVALGATTGRLPMTTSAGIAAPTWSHGSFSLRPMASFVSVRGDGASLTIGGEATLAAGTGRALTMRAGWSGRDEESDRWPLSAGFGATLGAITVDYAMERFPGIGQVTHRVGLHWARAR